MSPKGGAQLHRSVSDAHGCTVQKCDGTGRAKAAQHNFGSTAKSLEFYWSGGPEVL